MQTITKLYQVFQLYFAVQAYVIFCGPLGDAFWVGSLNITSPFLPADRVSNWVSSQVLLYTLQVTAEPVRKVTLPSSPNGILGTRGSRTHIPFILAVSGYLPQPSGIKSCRQMTYS